MNENELRKREYENAEVAGSIGKAKVTRQHTILDDYRSERDHLLARVSRLHTMIIELERDPEFAARLNQHIQHRNDY